MSVILVTGQPGSGKTAHVVDLLAHDEQFKGRPIFVMGIPDLTLPVIQAPPVEEWVEYRKAPEDETLELAYFTFPENALVVIDEAQRIFRPRAYTGSVPPHVSLVETHRHRGIDLYLITQHPTLIDKNIHRLMNEHHHLVRKFNTEWATAHEFYEVREHPDRYRVGSIENQFQYPKDVFKLYKSAELHTRRVKIPFRVKALFIMPIVLLIIAALGWMWFQSTYGKESTREKQEKANKTVQATGVRVGSPASTNPAGGSSLNYQNDYLASFVPAVAGLAYTAPAYAKVTEVKAAPAPTGCIASASRCQCYTDQGTKLPDVTEGICRQIVANGFFVAWQERPRDTQQNGGGGPERTRPAAPPPSFSRNPPASGRDPRAPPDPPTQRPTATGAGPRPATPAPERRRVWGLYSPGNGHRQEVEKDGGNTPSNVSPPVLPAVPITEATECYHRQAQVTPRPVTRGERFIPPYALTGSLLLVRWIRSRPKISGD